MSSIFVEVCHILTVSTEIGPFDVLVVRNGLGSGRDSCPVCFVQQYTNFISTIDTHYLFRFSLLSPKTSTRPATCFPSRHAPYASIVVCSLSKPHTFSSTMLGWVSSLRREISRKAVPGIPSSSSSTLIFCDRKQRGKRKTKKRRETSRKYLKR